MIVVQPVVAVTVLTLTLVAGVVVWRAVPAWRHWPPALGLLWCVGTIVPPHHPLALGVGTDDVPMLAGLVVLVLQLRLRHLEAVPRVPFGRLAAVGAGLLATGMVVSAFVNNEAPGSTLDMLVHGAARVVLYVLVCLAVLAQPDRNRTRAVVTAGLVGVATLESLVGLAAYLVGLPGRFGLEQPRGNTALLGEIPGRVIGTTGLSSNFLGALLVLSIPLTVGLALTPSVRWHRFVAGAAALVQLIALILTYTRVSLGVTVLALLVMLAVRGRLRWIVAVVALVAVLLVATPALQRITEDQTDRLALYASAGIVFTHYPVAGVGPGRMADFTAQDPGVYRATAFGFAGNNAHNTVLLAAAENGVAGLAGALLLNIAVAGVAVMVLTRSRRAPADVASADAALGVALGGFLLQGMTNNLFTVTFTASALVMLLAGCAWPALVAADPRPDED